MSDRVLMSLSALVVAVLLLPGCQPKTEPKPEPAVEETELTLLVPENNEYPDRDPPRLFTLTVDGKDMSKPRPEGKKVLRVRPAKGKDSVEIVMGFWHVNYSNTFRTRVVKVKPGEKATVDFTKEDPKTPDRFEAIFFESPESLLQEMMKLAAIGPEDTVMDIGCGDGRLVLTAVQKHGAKKGLGVDIRPELIDLCKENAKKAGVADKTEFSVQDALKMTDVSHVSAVFLYLGEDLSRKLQPLLQKTLKPGARVVSLDFPIGDWTPDETKKVTATNNYGRDQSFTLRLWKVK